MIHYLKTWPEHFEAVHQERKTFEIRENDRHFRVGDWLQLYEWCPKSKDYTGRVILTRVTYITDFEQKPGFVVMAIAPPDRVASRFASFEVCSKQLPEVKTSTQKDQRMARKSAVAKWNRRPANDQGDSRILDQKP